MIETQDAESELAAVDISLGIPTLDAVVALRPGMLAVVALPWEMYGDTRFVLAQALAKQGASPLCVHPSWSPYWDGALKVMRLEGRPVVVDYDRVRRQTAVGQPVLIDQFSKLHWEVAERHSERQAAVREAAVTLRRLAADRQCPVVVVATRKTRDIVQMSAPDLRSDRVLEEEADVLVMVAPVRDTGTADLLVVKHRTAPTQPIRGVPWPYLPHRSNRLRTGR